MAASRALPQLYSQSAPASRRIVPAQVSTQHLRFARGSLQPYSARHDHERLKQDEPTGQHNEGLFLQPLRLPSLHCFAMVIKERKTSIYLSLKVIQLINRLKSRVSGFPAKQSLLGSESCLFLESKTLRSLQKGLGRVQPHREKQLQACSNRVRKNRKDYRGCTKRQAHGGHRVQQYVDILPNSTYKSVHC